MGQLHVGLHWVFSILRGAAAHVIWRQLLNLFFMKKPFDLELVDLPYLDFSLSSV